MPNATTINELARLARILEPFFKMTNATPPAPDQTLNESSINNFTYCFLAIATLGAIGFLLYLKSVRMNDTPQSQSLLPGPRTRIQNNDGNNNSEEKNRSNKI